MVITDFNSMTIEELEVINATMGINFLINNGKIVGTEEIPTAPTKASRDK